jgi:hypothetical protein
MKSTLSSHPNAFGGPPTPYSYAFPHSCLHRKPSLFSQKLLTRFGSVTAAIEGPGSLPAA